MKKIAGLIAMSLISVSCSDLVIRVQKKSKQSEVKGVSDQEKASSVQEVEDFLSDMDNLRAVAFDLLMKQLKGKDFQSSVRTAVRELRANMIAEAKKKHNPATLSLDTSLIACKADKLDLNYAQSQKYVGVILKSAILAKLGDANVKALNSKLADESSAIAQLILKEIGVKIEGKSNVTRDGDVVTTDGDFKLSLVPFSDDSAELQEKDAKEFLTLKFVRVADGDYAGTFSADIGASELVGSETVQYEMSLDVSNGKVNGLTEYSSQMTVGIKEQAPNLLRKLTVTELSKKKYQVVDFINASGKEKQNSFVADLNLAGQCKVDDKKSDDKKVDDKGNDDKGGDKKDDDVPPPVKKVDDDSSKDDDKKVDDKDDDSKVNNPGQNPNQNAGQNPAQK